MNGPDVSSQRLVCIQEYTVIAVWSVHLMPALWMCRPLAPLNYWRPPLS
jgi:hypothetical protein